MIESCHEQGVRGNDRRTPEILDPLSGVEG